MGTTPLRTRTGTTPLGNLYDLSEAHHTAASENRCLKPVRKEELLVKTAGLVEYSNIPLPATESMKTSCKHVDIKNWHTSESWVFECLKKHKKRYDFRHMIISVGGLSPNEYKEALDDNNLLREAAVNISKKAAERIADRDLRLTPVVLGEREDHSTHKLRKIGRESAMQQIFDYIAVASCEEIWKRRMVIQQASSVKGRGPAYGAKMISRWLKADKRAERWAKEHGRRYFRKCRYFVKLDIEKCYQSLRTETFMKHFEKDCGNPDIVWLWRELLNSHHVMFKGEIYQGFMIGALPSQTACQYILSFIYRFAMGLHKRNGEKLVSHMMMHMDDTMLLSGDRRDLKIAAEEVGKYALDEFGLRIKPDWQIQDIDITPVDMMGYLIHGDGNVTVRPRIFLRARRLAMRTQRNGISLRQARRACSYKGFFKQKTGLELRSRKVYKKYHLNSLFQRSADIISRYERKRYYEERVQYEAG